MNLITVEEIFKPTQVFIVYAKQYFSSYPAGKAV